MSYAAMDGSATQFAGQNGYMPECVRARDDESRRERDDEDDEDEDEDAMDARRCRLKDLKMKSRHRRSDGRRDRGAWTRTRWMHSNGDD